MSKVGKGIEHWAFRPGLFASCHRICGKAVSYMSSYAMEVTLDRSSLFPEHYIQVQFQDKAE